MTTKDGRYTHSRDHDLLVLQMCTLTARRLLHTVVKCWDCGELLKSTGGGTNNEQVSGGASSPYFGLGRDFDRLQPTSPTTISRVGGQRGCLRAACRISSILLSLFLLLSHSPRFCRNLHCTCCLVLSPTKLPLYAASITHRSSSSPH